MPTSIVRIKKGIMKNHEYLFLIFFLALMVRLGMVAAIHDRLGYNYGPSFMYGEMAHYINLGEGMAFNPAHHKKAFGQWLKKKRVIDPADIPRPVNDTEDLKLVHKYLPGYAHVLAATFRIFGQERFVNIQVIQAVLSASSVFLIYGMATFFFEKKRVALLSALLYAIWIPEARLSILPYHDGFIPFLVIVSSYFYMRGLFDKKWWPHLVAGLLIGIAGHFRTNILLFPVFWVIFGWTYRYSRPSLLLGQCGAAIIALIILMPVMSFNQRLFNMATVVRSNFWHVAWGGLGQYKNPVGATASDRATIDMVHEVHPEFEYATPAYNDYLKGKVLTAIKDNPGWWVTTLVKRGLGMIYYSSDWGFPIRDDDEYDEFVSQGGTMWGYFKAAPDQFLYRVIPKLVRFAFLFTSLLGIFILRRWWKQSLPLLAAPAYFYLVHLPLYFEARILIPGMFTLLFFTAYFYCRSEYMTVDFYRKLKGGSYANSHKERA